MKVGDTVVCLNKLFNVFKTELYTPNNYYKITYISNNSIWLSNNIDQLGGSMNFNFFNENFILLKRYRKIKLKKLKC